MNSPSVNSVSTSAGVEADSRTGSRHLPSQAAPPAAHHIVSGFQSIQRFGRRSRKSTNLSLQDWDQPASRSPYHEYVHQLVGAGWDNLQDLDAYLSRGTEQPGLVVSVLDIGEAFERKRWPEIYETAELEKFMVDRGKDDYKVRLFVAEYQTFPAASMVEVLGSSLRLDPRFFQSAINSRGHVFTPSQRHRAPYISFGFGVLNATTPRKTDAEKFKALVYIQPSEGGNGWTGLVLFSSHTKINLSPRMLTDPPPFQAQLPRPKSCEPSSFRDLYLQALELIDPKEAFRSPFYAIANIGRLNCFCWNQIISAIREEDRRINGISDTSVGHAEEIKKSLAIVQRGGSLSWPGMNGKMAKDTQDALEEDFKHLVDQTDLLWQTRDKIAAIKQTTAESRWSSLTNAFTYFFAPITIMSGIYGMNVSQISGSMSNPNIWQFFVAVVAMNMVMVIVLAVSNWIQIQLKHNRTAGLKEVMKSAFGGLSYEIK